MALYRLVDHAGNPIVWEDTSNSVGEPVTHAIASSATATANATAEIETNNQYVVISASATASATSTADAIVRVGITQTFNLVDHVGNNIVDHDGNQIVVLRETLSGDIPISAARTATATAGGPLGLIYEFAEVLEAKATSSGKLFGVLVHLGGATTATAAADASYERIDGNAGEGYLIDHVGNYLVDHEGNRLVWGIPRTELEALAVAEATAEGTYARITDTVDAEADAAATTLAALTPVRGLASAVLAEATTYGYISVQTLEAEVAASATAGATLGTFPQVFGHAEAESNADSLLTLWMRPLAGVVMATATIDQAAFGEYFELYGFKHGRAYVKKAALSKPPRLSPVREPPLEVCTMRS